MAFIWILDLIVCVCVCVFEKRRERGWERRLSTVPTEWRLNAPWGAICLALRTRNGRLKNSFIPGGTLPTHPTDPKSGHVTKGVHILVNTIFVIT